MTKEKYKAYETDEIEVRLYAGCCEHAAECVKGLPRCF